ncbi:hypothetical protein AOQ84DRAFT_378985, partial [Glonium stellatum]
MASFDADLVMESVEAEPKLYRLVGEGLGGTFVWPDEEGKWVRAPRPIGTKGCITCVGVYMQVDANRSFLAHISVDPNVHLSNTPLASRALTNLTIARLQQHAEDNNWPCTRPPPFDSPATAVGSDFGSPPRSQNSEDAASENSSVTLDDNSFIPAANHAISPAGEPDAFPSAHLNQDLGLGLGPDPTTNQPSAPLSPPTDPSTPP